jgi:hypothetical protein
MSSFASSLIVLACVCAGAACGTLLHKTLPKQYLDSASQDVVRLGMGLVATMCALVLGLLISSAKSYYDTESSELTQMSAKVIFLDRLLANYGPETKQVRDQLRASVIENLNRVWPQENGQGSGLGPPSTAVETLVGEIQALSPKDESQRILKAQALNMAFDLYQNRWLLYELGATSVPTPMLVILVFWLTAIFLSFGVFGPHNATVSSALFVAALSVSGAIFLILEMYRPFTGLIQISSAPLRFALASLGQ